jgi:ATP-dependent DNA helicase RecQ
MVMHRPLNEVQLRRLNGVGERKLELYGKQFLAVIEQHEQAGQTQVVASDEALLLFRSGMTVQQVALQLKLSVNAIFGQLARAIAQGQLEMAEVVELPQAEVSHIQQVMIECERDFGAALKPVHEALGGAYEMGLLRCVRVGLSLDR